MITRTAAALLAVLNEPRARKSIGICGLAPVLPAVLATPATLGLPPMDTEFPELTHLHATFGPSVHLTSGNALHAKELRLASRTVDRLVTRSPNLMSFTYNPLTHITRSTNITVGVPAILTTRALMKLTLANVICPANDLRAMLQASSRTLNNITFENIDLHDGHWVEVFEDMRLLRQPEEFRFSGTLMETRGVWRVQHPDKNAEEICTSHLRERVRLWALRKVEEAPLLPSGSTGAEEQWRKVSDTTMKWSKLRK